MLPTYFEIKIFFIIAGIPPWDTGSSLFKASFYMSPSPVSLHLFPHYRIFIPEFKMRTALRRIA